MENRRIGSLEVTTVGLGCNNFGRRMDAAATTAVVNAALDAGINFLDTADVYGGTKSEEYIGLALGARRREVVIATKFGSKIDEHRQGAEPTYVRQAAEDSLRRLGTDYIDLYQIHQPHPETPIADTLGALDELVQAGKVREIGCSNFTVAQLREAEAAVQPGAARFVSVQNEYSLIHREPEQEVLAECARSGIAYLPYFPLASGLLTGKYRKGQAIPEGTRLQAGAKQLTDQNLELVESLIRFAESRGHTLLELAISWLASQPVIASVIAGATKPEQVKANATAAGWRLTDSDFAEVNSILSVRT
jgi:aryl-alcohol dehydrogenase-like predicted oxidoreductase